MSSVHKQPQN